MSSSLSKISKISKIFCSSSSLSFYKFNFLLYFLLFWVYLFSCSFFVFSEEVFTDSFLKENLSRAVKLQRAGRLRRAIKIYDQLLEIEENKKIATLYFNRALALREHGYPRKAIADFSRALKLNPQSDTLYFNRAVTYQKIGNYKLALQDFDLTVNLVPGDVKAIHNRAIVKYQLYLRMEFADIEALKNLTGAIKDAKLAKRLWEKLGENNRVLEVESLIRELNSELIVLKN